MDVFSAAAQGQSQLKPLWLFEAKRFQTSSASNTVDSAKNIFLFIITGQKWQLLDKTFNISEAINLMTSILMSAPH